MSVTKLLSSVAIASLLAMPAFAQTSTSPTTSPSTSRPATAPSGATTSRTTMPSDIGSMKVSELVGKNVYTANDEKIGDVNDVVVSKSGGQPMAVIGVGGFLGIGEKEAALPISELKVQGDKIVAAGATKDSLKQHADYKKDNYTKVDRNQMVGQAGTGTTGSTTRPSTSDSSMSPSGTSPSGAAGSSGTSGMSGSGSSSGSGSMGSGSSSTGGGSTMGGSSPAGNAPSSGDSSTQTPKQ